MGGISEIERTGLDGNSHTSLWRLLITLFALWLPTGVLTGLLLASQGPCLFNGASERIEAGGQSAEPHGHLVVVLTVPAGSLLQLSALWLGWTLLLNEYRRHKSKHRRRRRKFLDKLLQRTVTGLIAISMFACIPAFGWSLWRFYQACIRI